MLTSPANPIPLPKDVEAEIDKVRRQLIVSQQELLNTRKARHSEEVFISQITGVKEDLKNEVVELTEKVESLKEKKISIEKDLVRIDNESKKLAITNKETESLLRNNRVESEKLIKETEEKKSDIDAREIELKEKEDEFKKRDKKLQEFLTQVDSIIKNYGSY